MSMRRVNAHLSRRVNSRRVLAPFSGGGGGSFNGQFASLFPGAFQVVQSDIGLTYGGTMLATGTTPPVITLTGSLSGTPTAITITDTLVGILGTWQGLVTYGDSTTQAFTSAATVPLTGAGAGLTLNIAAGVAAGDNVWKATCTGLADQSGNAKNFSQGTSNRQPILTAGLNGKPGLSFDAIATFLDSALILPAPGTTPRTLYMVMTPAAKGSQQNFCGGAIGGGTSFATVSGALSSVGQFNGTFTNLSALTANPSRVFCDFTNSTADRNKMGAAAVVTGANTGNLATSVGWQIGAAEAGNLLANLTLFLAVNAPLMSPAQIAAADAAVAAFYGGSVLL